MSVFPPLSRADVLACVFSNWYPTFRKVSPKASVIRPLSNEFIKYLEMDRVFLPIGSGPMGISEMSDSDDDEDEIENDSDEEEYQVSFPELDAEIRRIITRYDGAVFPKLNWSSPQDASWMIPGGGLKCQHPADVYLLLKSSDFISHDLDHAFDACVEEIANEQAEIVDRIHALSVQDESETSIDNAEDVLTKRSRSDVRGYEFELVLKKWFDMPPSQEWRCFVRDQRLIAITQRDTNFYDFLQPTDVRQEIEEKISTFFAENIQHVFASASYIFDVYLTRSAAKMFIIDFNTYSSATSPLLFTYTELNDLAAQPTSIPVLRLITSATQSAQSMPPFSHNRYPKDVVDLSDGSSIAEFAKEWSKVLEKGVIDTLEET